jgi:hypothetical protein
LAAAKAAARGISKPPVASKDDQGRPECGETLDDGGDPDVVVRVVESLGLREAVAVEAGLGDIDADEAEWRFHESRLPEFNRVPSVPILADSAYGPGDCSSYDRKAAWDQSSGTASSRGQGTNGLPHRLNHSEETYKGRGVKVVPWRLARSRAARVTRPVQRES